MLKYFIFQVLDF